MKGSISICQVLSCQAAQSLRRERPWDTQRVRAARMAFSVSASLGQLKPPTSTPSLHPHLSWQGPVPSQPLPLLLAPSGAGCSLCLTCLSSPSPFQRSCLRCCCDSLTLQRHQSEWKKPNQAPGCAALYIFYSDSQA